MNERQNKNYIRMHRNKFIVVLLTAIIGAVVTTTFSVLRVVNSDHFAIIANRKDIKRVVKSQENLVSRTEHNKDIGNIKAHFDTRFNTLQDHIDQRFTSLENSLN